MKAAASGIIARSSSSSSSSSSFSAHRLLASASCRITKNHSNNNHHHYHYYYSFSCRRSFGQYSRMLDMGGAPSSFNDKNSKTRISTNKNCRLQAICFDFEVLTKYVPKETEAVVATTATTTSTTGSSNNSTIKLAQDVAPDAAMVQQVAELLNVDLGGAKPFAKPKNDGDDKDDLSLLEAMGGGNNTNKNNNNNKDETKEVEKKKIKDHNPFANDITSKYADKLRKRGVQGGLAEVELTKAQIHEAATGGKINVKGDAPGHLAARKMAAALPVANNRQTQWLALTGTGALLQYLTQRSMRLVLLPRPSSNNSKGNKEGELLELNIEEGQRMEDFKQQLNTVVFDQLFKDGRPGAPSLVQACLAKLKLDANRVLLVSDRDDYLRAAKESGLLTCRIVPPNAPRGNVSAHYKVESLPQVQDVVNEVNGISFSAILKSS